MSVGYLTLALSGPTKGLNCSVTPAFSKVPSKGDKFRIGYLNPTYSGAYQWAELRCKACILGCPQQRGTKSKLAVSLLPTQGPANGRNCYVNHATKGTK